MSWSRLERPLSKGRSVLHAQTHQAWFVTLKMLIYSESVRSEVSVHLWSKRLQIDAERERERRKTKEQD